MLASFWVRIAAYYYRKKTNIFAHKKNIALQISSSTYSVHEYSWMNLVKYIANARARERESTLCLIIYELINNAKLQVK